MRFKVPAMSVAIAGGDVYITSSVADLCRVSVLRGRSVEDIALIWGTPCVPVGFFFDSLLVSAGETYTSSPAMRLDLPSGLGPATGFGTALGVATVSSSMSTGSLLRVSTCPRTSGALRGSLRTTL